MCIFFDDVCLFKSFAHFPAGLFAFLLLNIKNSSCILDSSSLLDMFSKFFLLVCGFLLLLFFFFAEQKLLILIKSSLSVSPS